MAAVVSDRAEHVGELSAAFRREPEAVRSFYDRLTQHVPVDRPRRRRIEVEDLSVRLISPLVSGGSTFECDLVRRERGGVRTRQRERALRALQHAPDLPERYLLERVARFRLPSGWKGVLVQHDAEIRSAAVYLHCFWTSDERVNFLVSAENHLHGGLRVRLFRALQSPFQTLDSTFFCELSGS